MNMVFETEFGYTAPTLPLKQSGRIVAGNAVKVDWELVCPLTNSDEAYLLGNPPYLGARNQTPEQKKEMSAVFEGHEDYKNSDYVMCWFLKASKFIKHKNAQFAFVSTNSICQGEQVPYLWSRIFELDLQISFAHQSFLWKNSAKNNAGVTCVIVGVSNRNNKQKYIFDTKNRVLNVDNISPYLFSGSNYFIYGEKSALHGYPKMSLGNMARDGGNLILTTEEKDEIIHSHPEAEVFFRKLYGSQEFINCTPRWALWISDELEDEALKIREIKERVQKVYSFRVNSKAKTTNQYASIPHKFAQRCAESTYSVIVPRVSSERREYIPIGYLGEDSVVSDSANVIPDAPLELFGVLSSKLHTAWVRAIGGKLKTDFRYSGAICYNPFAIPPFTQAQVESIQLAAEQVLMAREAFPHLNNAALYDPKKMPLELKMAHSELDKAVEIAYFGKPLDTDEQRLRELFNLHEKLTR